MTDEAKQAIDILQKEILCVSGDCDTSRCCECDLVMPDSELIIKACKVAIKALEQEPFCWGQQNVDAISRQAVLDVLKGTWNMYSDANDAMQESIDTIEALPSVKAELKAGHCKDCKYFEYDSTAMVDGIPLIVAHEICSRWGNGCKTREDGYCFMFEPKAD